MVEEAQRPKKFLLPFVIFTGVNSGANAVAV